MIEQGKRQQVHYVRLTMQGQTRRSLTVIEDHVSAQMFVGQDVDRPTAFCASGSLVLRAPQEFSDKVQDVGSSRLPMGRDMKCWLLLGQVLDRMGEFFGHVRIPDFQHHIIQTRLQLPGCKLLRLQSFQAIADGDVLKLVCVDLNLLQKLGGHCWASLSVQHCFVRLRRTPLLGWRVLAMSCCCQAGQDGGPSERRVLD